jgi:ketosteroid isomerase-like protein
VAADDVDTVRRGYAAFNQGDVQTTLALFDRRVEIHLGRDAGRLLGGELAPAYFGHDGFMQFLGELLASWEDIVWEPEQLLDAGEGRVVVLVRMRATAKHGGREMDQPMAHVCTMREGRLVRHDTYLDRDEALAAAGLRGPG